MSMKSDTSPYLTRRLRSLEEVVAGRVLRRQPLPLELPADAGNDNGGAAIAQRKGHAA